MSEPYTTDELIDNMKAGLASVMGTTPISCDGSGSFSLSEAGTCGGLSGGTYRYKYLGPRGQKGEVVLEFTHTLVTRTNGVYYTNSFTVVETNTVFYTGRPQTSADYTLYPQTGGHIRQSSVSVKLLNTSCGAGPGFGGKEVELRTGPYIAFGIGSCGTTPTGFLFAEASNPDPNLATSGSLEAFINLCKVSTGGANGVRQYVVDGHLTQVEDTSASSYTVSYYSDAGTLNTNTGSYSPSGLGTVYTVSLISTTPEFRLRVASSSSHQDLVYTNEIWYIDNGNGYLEMAWAGSTNVNGLVTNMTYAALGTNGQVLFQESSTFLVATGSTGPYPLISTRTVGTGSEASTNYWFYNLSVPTTNVNYGQLAMIVQGNGYWERYEYSTNTGYKTKAIFCLGNAATNATESTVRVEEYDYTPFHENDDGTISPEAPRVIYSYYKGSVVEISASGFWLNNELQARINGWSYGSPIASLLDDNDTAMTLTTRLWATNGTGTRTIHPDQTLTISWSVTNAAGTHQTNFYIRGAGNESYEVTDGEITIAISTVADGKTQKQTTYDILSGQITREETYTYFGTDDKSYTIVYLDGTTNTYNHDCCHLESTIDRDGVTTEYIYNTQNRQVATTRLGITSSNVLDSAGNVIETWRFPSNGAPIRTSASTYDTQGRVQTMTDALNFVTTNSYSFAGDGRAIHTSQFPDGSSRQEYSNKDGTLDRLVGSASFPVGYSYDLHPILLQRITVETKLDAGGNTTDEWKKSYTDHLGRNYMTEYSAPAGIPFPVTLNTYNEKGQLEASVDLDGNSMFYSYNANGEMTQSWIDMDGNGLQGAGDRITSYASSIVQNDESYWVRRQSSWLENSTGSSTNPDAISEVSLDGNRTWNKRFGVASKTVRSRSGGTETTTVYTPEGTYSKSTSELGRSTGVTNYDSGGQVLGGTSYTYDAHGRQWKTSDLRNGTTSLAFDSGDRVVAVTNPPAVAGGTNTIVQMRYDSMGRKTNEVQADGKSVYTSYYANGLPKRTWGARTYPVEYAYDAQGRMTNMMTWQNFSADSGKANTRWIYDAYRGFLAAKRYADNQGPTYTNLPSGKLWKRVWARGVVTTYDYNAAGQIASIDYSDSTPDVTYIYDIRGNLATNLWGTNIMIRRYHDSGEMISETVNGITVTNRHDQYLRRTNLSVVASGSKIYSAGYGYSAAGRLDTVTDGTNSATYSYLANSPLVEQILFKQNGTNRMTTTKTYDFRNRLTKIQSVNTQAVALSSFAYAYNAANQRTSVTNVDGTRWIYTYDSLGQVTVGKKYWADGTPVAGQQFEYGFDDIGNRSSAGHGGNQNGANLRYEAYTANNLNQYTQRTVSGYADIMGAANSSAVVTVNNQPTYRKGDYYRAELTVTNGAGSVYASLTNVAVLADGANPDIVTNAVGSLFVPKTPETFGYDLDGNMTNDGRWAMYWDGENRLTSMQTLPGAAGPVQRLGFAYDPQSRRILKSVEQSNGTWSVTLSNKFVYDGWNLVAELNATNNASVRGYLWGTDLSGTLHDAGGVGGLLAVNKTGLGTHVFAYDGNGNIAALIDAGGGSVSAAYEYGVFGEVIGSTGPMAKANPFWFSTKYQDDETDFLYYGYRYYNASTGRWLSRDPIEEQGGKNLYGFVRNDPIRFFDKLGLVIVNLKYEVYIETATVTFFGRTFNGGTKIRHSVNVNTDTEALSQVEKYIGPTTEYDAPGGNVIGEGQARGSTVQAYIDFRGPSRGQGERFFRVKMVGDEGNPLVSSAPGITYEVYIYFRKCSRKIFWNGEHDRFPSHDFYVKGSRAHHFSHVAAGTTPASLFSVAPNESFRGEDSY